MGDCSECDLSSDTGFNNGVVPEPGVFDALLCETQDRSWSGAYYVAGKEATKQVAVAETAGQRTRQKSD